MAADTRIKANTVNDLLGVQTLTFCIGIQFIEVSNTQSQIGICEQLDRLGLSEAHVLCAHPVELQLEDFLHDARRVFIYNQMVLVFRVFLIPVSCKAADELSFFPFYISDASVRIFSVCPLIGSLLQS